MVRSWLGRAAPGSEFALYHEVCTTHAWDRDAWDIWLVPLLVRDARGRPKRHRWVWVDARTGRIGTSGVSVCGPPGPPVGCRSRD
jgi:hypothetical protein